MITINDKKGNLILSCHDDASIFVLEEGRGRLFTPEGIDADNPPDHIVLATAIAGFARTEKGLQTIMAWFQEQMDEAKQEDA